jgi:hypothetical protein
MESGGARTWYFPDGWLPQKTAGGALEAHEALMILNTSSRSARVSLDIYFEKGNPVKDIPVAVPAERVICLRLDKPEELGGLRIPTATQYAIRLRSDINVIAQFGRLDTTQPNLAYYTTMGYHEKRSR